MAQFKPASRPGSYNQAIAPVDNVTPLRAKQETERANEVHYNKLIADAHRNYNKTWESGVKAEGSSRQTRLDFDRLVRGQHQKFEQQAIQASYDTALRNSQQQQAQTNRDTKQIVDFVSKAVDTGFTIYKARDEAINKSQTNALQNTILRQGTSIEQLAEIRGITLDLINDENTTDARVLKYRELGYSNEQLRSIIGAREGVYALAEANAVKQAINLLPVTMFNSGMPLAGFPEGTTPSTLRAAGDTAGLHQAHTQHVQSILRQTGRDFNPATVQDAVQKSLSSVLSQGAQVHKQNETARFESEQINQVRNNVLAGTLPQRWAANSNLIHTDLGKWLPKLAGDPSSGVTKEFITNLREQVNPATGIKYGDQYGYEIDKIYDAIHSEEVHQFKVEAHSRKLIAETIHDSLDKIAAEGGTITPEGATKIREDAIRRGLRDDDLNRITARLNALGTDTEEIEEGANLEWANTVKNNPHLIGWTESKIWEVAPNRKWAQKKITEMYTRQGRDEDLKSAKSTIETALKKRLGEQIKDRYGSETFYAAYDDALEKYKTRRADLGKNGHTEALKLFDNELGSNKHAGIYAVPDVSKDTETIGFNNFQLSAVDINTEPKTYKSLSDDLDKAASKPSLVSSRLAAIGNIDTSHITTEDLQRFAGNHGNINAPDDPEMWRKMQQIRDAIGGRTTTMDAANAILAARGVEVKTYKAPTTTANRLLEEVEERHGKGVAGQLANGAPTRGQGGRPSYVTHDHAYGEIPDKDLATVAGPVNSIKMYKEVAPHLQRMVDDAAEAGHTLKFNSGYRSGPEQQHLFETKPAGIAAPRGTSEHELGYSVDLHYSDAGYKWLQQNAHKYGFQPFAPGLGPDDDEAWHWTFRGVSGANKLHTPITVQPATESKTALADGEYRDVPGYDDIKLTTWEGQTWMALKKPDGEWIRIPANLENREKLRGLDRKRWEAVTRAMNDA